MGIDRCPACDSERRENVLRLPDLPVLINAQMRPDEALGTPLADIDLVVCIDCGHLYNAAFDPSRLEYDATYENTLHYSPHFRRFADQLCDRLVREHQLVGRRVAELGSGPGHFLAMLCDAGVGAGYGFDPSHDPERLGAPEAEQVSLSNAPYPTDGSLQVDLAYSQHVLEHLTSPSDALGWLATSVSDARGSVYSEVPNGLEMIRAGALWDLIYEHISYFTPSSLRGLCHRSGLAVTGLGTAFDDQFLWCEAVPSGAPDSTDAATTLAETLDAVRTFALDAHARIDAARSELSAAAAAGPVALWGAGSKGATYLNLVPDHHGQVTAVIDINPRKHGFGVPGTPYVIEPPESLCQRGPATVFLANPTYEDEVAATLGELGITADLRPLWSR